MSSSVAGRHSKQGAQPQSTWGQSHADTGSWLLHRLTVAVCVRVRVCVCVCVCGVAWRGVAWRSLITDE